MLPPPVTPPVEPTKYTTEEVDYCKGVYCDPVYCSDDEVWSQGEGDCCPGCVKIPHKGCATVYKPVVFEEIVVVKGVKCKPKKPMITSACSGVCGSTKIWLKNETYRECSCCEAYDVEKVLLPVQCYPERGHGYNVPEPYDDYYEYVLVKSCTCEIYNCMDEKKPHGEILEMQMESYTDVLQNMNAYNGY